LLFGERWRNNGLSNAGNELIGLFSEEADLKMISDADASLLLACLQNILSDGNNYQEMSIISSDYGVKRGAEIMFKNSISREVKDKKKIQTLYRPVRIIGRNVEDGEEPDYQTQFDSYHFVREGFAKEIK